MAEQTPDVAAFLNPGNIIAVVGVSADPSKYGNKVFFDLLNAGYRVRAVHRDGGEVQGHPRYRSLAELPETPDVVNTVVPPKVTEEIVAACAELGIKKVWMQPGSESERAIELCREHGIAALHDACIMVQRKRVP